MYSKVNIAKRDALRSDPIVVEAINEFMQEFHTNAQRHCSKEEYFKVFMKIGTILKPGIEADDLNRIIKEDFETDSMDKLVIKDADREDHKKVEEAQNLFDNQP